MFRFLWFKRVGELFLGLFSENVFRKQLSVSLQTYKIRFLRLENYPFHTKPTCRMMNIPNLTVKHEHA
jgi:hypothetical protein